ARVGVPKITQNGVGRYRVTFDVTAFGGGTVLALLTRSDGAAGPPAAGQTNITGTGSVSFDADVSVLVGSTAQTTLHIRAGGTTLTIGNVVVRPIGLLSDPRPIPAPILATRDAGRNGQSALLVGMTG